MSCDYYLRWKSVVNGPYVTDDIRDMLAKGRITKHHQISTEKKNWVALFESADFKNDCQAKPLTFGGAYQSRQDADGVTAETEPIKLRIRESDIGRGATIPRLNSAEQNSPGGERWYYVQNGQTAGPVSLSDLRSLVDGGVIEGASPICREGEERWQKAREAFPGFWSGQSMQGRQSASALPEGPSGHGVAYAGFWLRLCAYFIDTILSAILTFLCQLGTGFVVLLLVVQFEGEEEAFAVIASVVGYFVGFLANWLYFAASESGGMRATPGKRALDLSVTDLDGQQISFGRATGRYFGKIISGLILCFG